MQDYDMWMHTKATMHLTEDRSLKQKTILEGQLLPNVLIRILTTVHVEIFVVQSFRVLIAKLS